MSCLLWCTDFKCWFVFQSFKFVKKSVLVHMLVLKFNKFTEDSFTACFCFFHLTVFEIITFN